MNSIFSIILIIISVGSFFIYIDPEYQEIQIKLSEISKLKVDQNKENEITRKIRELGGDYNQIDLKDKNRIEKLLPDNINNIRLIVDIQRIIEKGGLAVNIENISLAKKQEKIGIKNNDGGRINIRDNKDYESVDISFSILTSYDVLKEFITKIRESLRILDISSLELSVQKNNRSELIDNLKVSMVLKAYWLKK